MTSWRNKKWTRAAKWCSGPEVLGLLSPSSRGGQDGLELGDCRAAGLTGPSVGQENSARLGLLLRKRDKVGFLDGKGSLEVVAVNCCLGA